MEHCTSQSPKPSGPLPIIGTGVKESLQIKGNESSRPISPTDIIKDMWKNNAEEEKNQPKSVVIDDVKAMWQLKKGLEKEEVEITLDESVYVDPQGSKYFRMNSYALSTLAEYTTGTVEDFMDSSSLPSGWKFRYCGPRSSPQKSTHFLTPDKSHVVKSRLGAIEWLRLTGVYTRDQLWGFATLLYVPEKRFEKLF